MDRRPLGRTGLNITPIGFGAFKIGRNEKIKYPQPYDLPDEDAASAILNGVLDAGINYIDTAPAYGISEERIGRLLADRRGEFVCSTKVGETFADGESTYAFDAASIASSVERSRERLGREQLDLVFVHSDGRDLQIQQETEVIATLQGLKDAGVVRAIGFSGKTVAGATMALEWADAIMVEYNAQDRSHEAVMQQAHQRGIGVVVKKGLASGHLPAAEAVQAVLANAAVTSLVIGGLNLDHMRANIRAAQEQLARSVG